MQRVMIIGGPGAGKSTLARHIAARLGVEPTHMDQLFWRPGWTEAPPEEVRAEVAEVVARPVWVIDGNYSGTWDLRGARADTLILMDMPTGLRLWRVLRRILTGYGRVRPDMSPGCPERLDWAFLVWTARYGRDHAPGLRAFAEQVSDRLTVHRLRGRCEVAAFLRRFDRAEPG